MQIANLASPLETFCWSDSIFRVRFSSGRAFKVQQRLLLICFYIKKKKKKKIWSRDTTSTGGIFYFYFFHIINSGCSHSCQIVSGVSPLHTATTWSEDLD